MVDTTQSPLAMLVLVTPYTVLYVVNQLFLHGILDKIHYLFFELIFVLAFRKVFGLPDLTERFFPSQEPVHIHSFEGVQPVKTHLVGTTASTAAAAIAADITECVTFAGTGVKAPSVGTKMTKTSVGASKTTTFQDEEEIKTAHGSDSSMLRSRSRTVSSHSTKKLVLEVKETPYAKELAAMETKVMDYINNTDIWEKVYDDSASINAIQVFQYKSRPMCYKIIANMSNTAAVTFDALCDLDRRSEWDPMCVEARVLEAVAPGTTIQYVRTKAVWPTASRDTVVLGAIKDLGEKGLFMVNASCEHASMPERAKEKIVRMETTVAGHIIVPLEGDPMRCRLTQILDADLKGWIPDKVIQMVSTKAVPDGLRAVNALIPKTTPYLESKILAIATQARLQAESILNEPRPGNDHAIAMLEGHENDLEADPVEQGLELPSEDDKDHSECGDSTRGEQPHELSRRRSESNSSLTTLSDRNRVVTDTVEGERRDSSRPHSRTNSGEASSDHKKRMSTTEQKKTSAGALEKTKSTSTFRVFWEGIKENLGFGLAGKANKILVAVIIVAVLGSSVAKLKRR
ncbi:START domain-containing protein 10 [Mortierella alpina]|uniref:START domain-containing protein 10 n=1 Tax=Mortierella alpina TaxID=64518 RepID=A0A9P6J6D8_MORAP|nr:START domain-containing protein 10 [Mortierella alpina]